MCSSAEEILEFLTTRQHLQPHRSVRDVLGDVSRVTGACPLAVNRAMQWLDLAPEAPVGRLRRTTLTQLARSIHRFWRAATSREAVNNR
jgi:hypothetical protein